MKFRCYTYFSSSTTKFILRVKIKWTNFVFHLGYFSFLLKFCLFFWFFFSSLKNSPYFVLQIRKLLLPGWLKEAFWVPILFRFYYLQLTFSADFSFSILNFVLQRCRKCMRKYLSISIENVFLWRQMVLEILFLHKFSIRICEQKTSLCHSRLTIYAPNISYSKQNMMNTYAYISYIYLFVCPS